MNNPETFKPHLRQGDETLIAEIVGCSQSLVNFIFAGKRNADTETGRKILKAAKALIEFRGYLKNTFIPGLEKSEVV